MSEERLGRFNKQGYKNSFSKGELANELVYMNRDYDKLQSQLQEKEKIIEEAIEYVNHAQNYGKEKHIYVNGDDVLSILERK